MCSGGSYCRLLSGEVGPTLIRHCECKDSCLRAFLQEGTSASLSYLEVRNKPTGPLTLSVLGNINIPSPTPDAKSTASCHPSSSPTKRGETASFLHKRVTTHPAFVHKRGTKRRDCPHQRTKAGHMLPHKAVVSSTRHARRRLTDLRPES